METLDPHMVVKILSYLPSKKLAELRSVRRQWNVLVGLNLKSSVKEIELKMDSSSFEFQFVKPWKTKSAPIQRLSEIFEVNLLSIFDPISVTKIKIRTDNPQVLEHIPFYVFKGLLSIGVHCPNVQELDLSNYLLKYAEEIARLNLSYLNISTLKVHEIEDTGIFAELRNFSVGSCNGRFPQFLYQNSATITSLTMPLSWGQVEEDELNRSKLALNRLTFLHLTSVGDLKTQLTRTFFHFLINLDTLIIENTREYTFNAQAMTVLADSLQLLPKLRHLSIEHYRSQRPLSIIGNGTQQPIYDLLLSVRNLTSLCLRTEVSKPSVLCHAISVAADQSSLESLELEFRGSTTFLEYCPLLQCARTAQFTNLKRLTLHNVSKSNILVLITKKCPSLDTLRLNKDELTEDEVSKFVIGRMNIARYCWQVFNFEIQKSSRWYAVFIRKIMTFNPPRTVATIKIEMYTTTENNLVTEDNIVSPTGLVPAYKMWNNETKNIMKIFDLVKFSAYTDTKNYLFGNFNY